MTAPRSPSGWPVVVAYACVVAVTQMLWLTFAAIDVDVARQFGVSKNAIGWLAEVFPLVYVLFALPAGIALDRWFRGSLATGAALTAFGAVVRIVSQTFAFALAGQLIVAIAQPLVLGALTKTATGYLPERDRPAGIAIGSAGQFVGAVSAFAMAPLLKRQHDLGPLLPIQAALAVIAATALIGGLRRRPAPDTPLAAAGLAQLRAVWRIGLTKTLSQLAFVGIGVFVAVSTWLQPILHHDRISSGAAGAMLVAMLITGTMGCALMPRIIARARAERLYLTFAVLGVSGCFAVLAGAHALIGADFALIAAIGYLLLAGLPVMLELAERTMGAAGGVVTGILLLAGNAGGLAVAVAIGALDNNPAIAFTVLAVIALAGLPAARRLPSAADVTPAPSLLTTPVHGFTGEPAASFERRARATAGERVAPQMDGDERSSG